ncbi:MAG: hypothetical protein AB8F78_13065 [Saprospiraceae bacterium]
MPYAHLFPISQPGAIKDCLLVLVLSIFSSCQNTSTKASGSDQPAPYSFLVAGHTYGNPLATQYGLYPPLVNQIPFFNDYPGLDVGILAGDVVPIKTQAYWDSARADIDQFAFPIHIAAGNHDRGSVFESFYPYFDSFWKEDDLFIILSPTNWNIEGEQKEFLMETLRSATKAANVFIFCHELIWWSPDNEFSKVKINYKPHYPGSSNYWSEISPVLAALPNNVVIFAGDLGATAGVSPYMYHQYGNITLIATGMGGGRKDNVIITKVDSDGSLSYELLGLKGDYPVELAKLEDYQLR